MTDEVRDALRDAALMGSIMEEREHIERILAAGHGREDTTRAMMVWMGETRRLGECVAAMLFALIDRDQLLRKVNRRARHLLEGND